MQMTDFMFWLELYEKIGALNSANSKEEEVRIRVLDEMREEIFHVLQFLKIGRKAEEQQQSKQTEEEKTGE